MTVRKTRAVVKRKTTTPKAPKAPKAPNSPKPAKATSAKSLAREQATIRKKSLFLNALAKELNATRAATHAGIDTSTAYKWRKDDVEFAKHWQDCVDKHLDEAESTLKELAIGEHKYTKGVYYRGKRVGEESLPPDIKALQMLLAAYRPDLWSQRRQHELSGAVQTNVIVTLDQ